MLNPNFGGNSVRRARTLLAGAALSLGLLAGCASPGEAGSSAVCRNRAYVANSYGNTVSVIDTSANQVIATIPVAIPYSPVIAPNGRHVYVVSTESGTVPVIDVRTNTITSTLDVGPHPTGMDITPDGERLVVSLLADTQDENSNVRIVNLRTGVMSALIPVGRQPERLTISPDGRYAYVGNRDATLTIIDIAREQVVGSITMSGAALAGVFSGEHLYMAQGRANRVAIINLTSRQEEASIPIEGGVMGMAMSPDGRSIYVTTNRSGTIQEISVARRAVTRSAAIDARPGLLSLSPDGRFGYVAHSSSTYVAVIDLTTLTEVAQITTAPPARAATLFGNGPTHLDVC